MTRGAGFMAVVCLILIVLLFGMGLTGQPMAAALAMVCALPLFMMFAGFAIGRASNEFQVVRRERTVKSAQPGRVMRREPLS